MRRFVFIIFMLLIACAPLPTPEPIEGMVADKKYKESWSTSENYYYGCSYDFMESETKCGYKFHMIPKVTTYPEEFHIVLEDGSEVKVSGCVYDILDVGEFYSEKENYGCEQ